MRISDWSSDVCASDLASERVRARSSERRRVATKRRLSASSGSVRVEAAVRLAMSRQSPEVRFGFAVRRIMVTRSEEHTSELQSLMRISYAVFCLKKQNTNTIK